MNRLGIHQTPATSSPMTSQIFETTIASDTAAGQAVQEKIIALLEANEFSTRDVFGMRLSLEEAIVNAIKHGNGYDPDKSVTISCDVSSERVIVSIEDQGDGFDLSSVPDPTDDINLDKPSGRGIMLMHSFLTSVSYLNGGRCVRLEKIRSVDE